jgi:hypothetical protein
MIVTSYDESIHRTLEAYRKVTVTSEDDVVASLVAVGMSRLQAEKLVALVPLAFGRVLISHMEELEFATDAVLQAADGSSRSVDLRNEPIFARALEMAAEMYHRGANELFGPAAISSGELLAVNKALNSGATLAGAKFSEPRFLRVTFEEWRQGSDQG